MSCAIVGRAGPEEPPTQALAASATGTERFEGTVTAIDTQLNYPGRVFSAIDADGVFKMFEISSLEHLDVGKRVTLEYRPADSFPLVVTRIQFHQPVPRPQPR